MYRLSVGGSQVEGVDSVVSDGNKIKVSEGNIVSK